MNTPKQREEQRERQEQCRRLEIVRSLRQAYTQKEMQAQLHIEPTLLTGWLSGAIQISDKHRVDVEQLYEETDFDAPEKMGKVFTELCTTYQLKELIKILELGSTTQVSAWKAGRKDIPRKYHKPLADLYSSTDFEEPAKVLTKLRELSKFYPYRTIAEKVGARNRGTVAQWVAATTKIPRSQFPNIHDLYTNTSIKEELGVHDMLLEICKVYPHKQLAQIFAKRDTAVSAWKTGKQDIPKAEFKRILDMYTNMDKDRPRKVLKRIQKLCNTRGIPAVTKTLGVGRKSLLAWCNEKYPIPCNRFQEIERL
jgi:DNA-binding transcriptional regulator YdaS (Cro superfamily)